MIGVIKRNFVEQMLHEWVFEEGGHYSKQSKNKQKTKQRRSECLGPVQETLPYWQIQGRIPGIKIGLGMHHLWGDFGAAGPQPGVAALHLVKRSPWAHAPGGASAVTIEAQS